MSRFLIEQMPRTAAYYRVTPLSFAGLQEWLGSSPYESLVQTLEMTSAIEAACAVELHISEAVLQLRPGDEALLVTLSFEVLLAWAEGKIAPLPEDWRCLSLTIAEDGDGSVLPVLEAAVVEDLPIVDDVEPPFRNGSPSEI